MSRRYESIDDLNHDLDRQSLVDEDDAGGLDEEDLKLLAPPVRRAPAAPVKPARRTATRKTPQPGARAPRQRKTAA